MLAIHLTLLVLLPALAIASSAHLQPAHLRHRYLAKAVRHIADGSDAARAIVPKSVNDAHRDAHRAIKQNIRKRQGEQCTLLTSMNHDLSPSPTSFNTISSQSMSDSDSSIPSHRKGQGALGKVVVRCSHKYTSVNLTCQTSTTQNPTSTTSSEAWSSSASTTAFAVPSQSTSSDGTSLSVGNLLSLNIGYVFCCIGDQFALNAVDSVAGAVLALTSRTGRKPGSIAV
jgi:hypothetical protein